ncbi:DNA-(apurinic or apyrimidinic site) endonuclease 2 isoform X2 [Cornus florida]|uniref:DNA-(apurinic or apyrimidinic site) endonuclease 2 isoform X2 n=1 Tax=Cornus florida TaxID=4283 RepID=UPI00289E3BDE|nr:DNA-(apurinic or apyrimidinic site) endonuclease 2 isoform X2 [Cornus florida]
MKIVTYNINGLNSRISQFGSLLKLLDSLDADIICFQETKLTRQQLTADLVIADGYECFFSCTRTSNKGRVGYSGVATFCRVKSAFSSNEVPLPLAAEEGFTGVLETLQGSRARKDRMPAKVEGLEEFPKDELLKIDSEGRCIVTDHSHFVLFNIYGPRAHDDAERVQFKLTFFKILQKRWECLLRQGRNIIVVGDLNIAPAAIDSCNPGPDFEKNEFRAWFRSLLVDNGGPFFDVFRAKHPDRREAYTHWRQDTGAEEFNYGTRIDHILSAGSCLHEEHDQQCHSFVKCHVKECDMLMQFKRRRPENSPRWKDGRSIKLEGSDHIPVYMSLVEIPDILQHSTPSLSARYAPEVRGIQQTIVSMLIKRQVAEQVETCGVSSSFPEENSTGGSCSENLKRSSDGCIGLGISSEAISYSSNLESEVASPRTDEYSGVSSNGTHKNLIKVGSDRDISKPGTKIRKKPRQGVSSSNQSPIGTFLGDHASSSPKQCELNDCASTQDQGELNSCCNSEKEKTNVAILEWQRIQQLMQNSIPLCKGHGEACVVRVVKKPGPTFGHRFFVCARSEGPASNPETNCGYFKWATTKPKRKG